MSAEGIRPKYGCCDIVVFIADMTRTLRGGIYDKLCLADLGWITEDTNFIDKDNPQQLGATRDES